MKITPQLDVKLLIVTVDDGERVVMSEQAAATIVGESPQGLANDPYYVQYQVITELLNDNNYRIWGEI